MSYVEEKVLYSFLHRFYVAGAVVRNFGSNKHGTQVVIKNEFHFDAKPNQMIHYYAV